MRIRSTVILFTVIILGLLLLSGCRQETPPVAGTDDDPVASHSPESTPETETTPSDVSAEDESSPDEEIIATVNSVRVLANAFERSKQQVLSRYQQIYSQFGQDVRALLGGAQGRLFELRIEDEALELATTRALVTEVLEQNGLAISDEAAQERFQSQYTDFLSMLSLSDDEFRASFDTGGVPGLQTGGLTYDQFIDYAKQSVREEMEINAVQAHLAGDIQASDEELLDFFEEHRANYDTPEQVRASHILVETEDLAQQLLSELDAGADFSELAREHSIDPGSGSRGGDLNWFGRGQMVEPFEIAAFSTPVGERSDIVTTQYGYHIILVMDYQAAATTSFEEAVDQVRDDYESNVRAESFSAWVNATRPEAIIVIEDPMLNAFRILQSGDAEASLAAFLELRDTGGTDDPYLEYVIGSVYETLMEEARSKKLGIEGHESLTPSQQEEIIQLQAQMDEYLELALTTYREALVQLDDDPELKARIQALDPPEAPAAPEDE